MGTRTCRLLPPMHCTPCKWLHLWIEEARACTAPWPSVIAGRQEQQATHMMLFSGRALRGETEPPTAVGDPGGVPLLPL